jgi:cell division protein FtsZ
MKHSDLVISKAGSSPLTISIDDRVEIKVIGVGSDGGNAINHMIASGLSGVSFIAANTDSYDLGLSQAKQKVQLGAKLSRGLGAGGDPRVGFEAAIESEEQIRQAIRGANMLFIVAGMGCGAGAGAAPVIARVAKELGILTVGVVTKAFFWQGPRFRDRAQRGIEELSQYVDSLIDIRMVDVFTNAFYLEGPEGIYVEYVQRSMEEPSRDGDSLITIPNSRVPANRDVPIVEMVKEIDDAMLHAVRGISELITNPGYISLDFNDAQKILANAGMVIMGTGRAKGESRAREAAMQTISSFLMEDVSIEGARHVLINVTADKSLQLEEVTEAVTIVAENAHPDRYHVFFGMVIDESMGAELRVTVYATGIDNGSSNAENSCHLRDS